ncbi:MAG: methyltransferase domain-containing protein [Pyrinomonadaceae bacterium]|nr:methyltransferase domain-containing protein [Phycisphaerales bacterium]
MTTASEHTPSQSSHVAGPAPTSLDDLLAQRLPGLSKRERRRLVERGEVRINGHKAQDVGMRVSASDEIAIPAPREVPQAEEAEPSAIRVAPVPSLEDQDQHSPIEMQRMARDSRSRSRRPTRFDSSSASHHGPAGGETSHKPRERLLPGGIRIVHEDDDVIVVEKPPGIITADPTRTNGDTLFDKLKQYIAETHGRQRRRTFEDRQRIWVIHRLDKEASGLLVFAKTPHAYESLKEEFRAKRITRLYIAVTEGVIGPAGQAGTCQSFLREEPSGKVVSIDSSKFRGSPDSDDMAKLAVTHYRVLGSRSAGQHMRDIDGTTLVQVRLETGRKHQIRVHMASLNHPLVGDHRYGAKTDGLKRLSLHAAELGFTHPTTGLKVRLNSPAPASFYRLVGIEPPSAIAPRAADGPQGLPPPRASTASDPALNPGKNTSWDRVAEWYDELLDDKGNDHYEHVIVPGAIRLIDPTAGMKFLDVACGQGVLCRRLAAIGVKAVGVDLAPQLIAAAQRRSPAESEGAANPTTPEYHVGDARDLASLPLKEFDAAACVMALMNIDPLESVFTGVHSLLRKGGSFTIIISHPVFRAAGQTSWEWDQRQGKQYRRIDGYLSSGQKRIQMHPGADPNLVTWTFHRPIQTYARLLTSTGFAINAIEEWPGRRISTSGPRALEENRARREIPLFLAIRAVKQEHPER